MSLQPNEVLIIVLVALIVLGPKRLPGAIRSIGNVFRQVREFSTTVRQEIDATLSPPKIDTTTEAGPAPGATTTETAIPPEAPVTDTSAAQRPDAHVTGAGSASDDDTAIDRSTSDGAA